VIAACSRRRIASGLVLLAALACVLPAAAATRRFAVIVANNRGAEGQPTLQFAEADAEKLALVLTELGGVAAADLTLLRGIAPSGVRGALGSVAEKVRQVHAAGADRAIVIFYYSGHSDGESLELGQDRLGFAELRTLLSSTGADIRVVLLDSCRSGALLALKGGQPAPAFQIRLSDEIASSGEALISSSASDEMALESREIKGSFFTHHLVSGLRGAADTSGDGRVTLAEAYEYVFKRTVTATAATTIGPQHPGYTYRLSGEGELVLTDLNVRTARLTIPTGLDRALIIDRRSERVLAEVGPGGASSLALPSGDYLVRATVGRSAMAATLHLRDGEQRTVSAAELSPAAVERATGKGFLQPEIAIWSLSVGASDGVADGMGMQLALRGSRQRGAFELAVQMATASNGTLRETSGFASVAYSPLRLGNDVVALRGGPEVGAGAIYQSRPQDSAAWSTAAVGGIQASFSVRIGVQAALTLSGHLLGEVLRQDSAIALRPLPSAFIGLSIWP
jgi:hypothetical protein